MLDHGSEFLRGPKSICCYSARPYDPLLSIYSIKVGMSACSTLSRFGVISCLSVGNFFHMRQYRVNWNVDYLNGVFVCHWLPPTAITPGSLVALAFNALGPAVIPDVVSYNMLVP